MKKIFVSLLVLSLMVSVSFAAKGSTPKGSVATTNTSSSGGMRWGIGTLGASNINCGIITIPISMAGMRFATDSYSIDLSIGLSNTSAGGTSTSATGLGSKFTLNLSEGKVTTHWGGGLAYLNLPNTITATVLSVIYGAETYIAKDFVIGVDIYPVSYTSETLLGASSTNINLLTGTVYGYYMF
jgi:hypothetical protein